MGSAEAELKINKRNTTAMIAADPTDIVIMRSARTEDGAGGYTDSDPAPLPAQRVKIAPVSVSGTVRQNVDGEDVTPDFVMLAEWDADIARGDKFTTVDGEYEIVYVLHDMRYEKLSEITFLRSTED